MMPPVAAAATLTPAAFKNCFRSMWCSLVQMDVNNGPEHQDDPRLRICVVRIGQHCEVERRRGLDHHRAGGNRPVPARIRTFSGEVLSSPSHTFGVALVKSLKSRTMCW